VAEPGTPTRRVLLTGFPGFIGARLVPRILEKKPGSRLVCLVQEKFLGVAKESLASIERAHPETRGRLDLLLGDITLPGLGIEATARRELGRSLREAYHLAAVYDLAVRPEVALRVNVEGTRHVLELLDETPGFERLHYVSTAFVSGRARGTFRETDLDVGQTFKNAYEETKFRAEVEVARSGVPRTVYRPGIVVGDSRTGETAKFDGPYSALRLMEALPSPGVFPRVGDGTSTVNIVPIDFVVEALCALSASEATAGQTYHLCDPRPLPTRELVEMFARSIGKRFVQVPVPLGLARAVFHPRFVQSFFGMPKEALDYFDDPVRHDTTASVRALSPLGIECPPLRDYIGTLVGFYRTHRSSVRREAMT